MYFVGTMYIINAIRTIKKIVKRLRKGTVKLNKLKQNVKICNSTNQNKYLDKSSKSVSHFLILSPKVANFPIKFCTLCIISWRL